MLTHLKFEIFDPEAGQLAKRGFAKTESFVYEITGYRSGQFLKKKLPPFRDYANANSCGSRGIFESYFLEQNKLYEIQCQINWKKQDHYFCMAKNGTLERLSMEDVARCLSQNDPLG